MAELVVHLFDRYLSNLSDLEADIFSDVAISEDTVELDKRNQPTIFTKWKFLLAIARSKWRSQDLHIKETVWPECMIRAREAISLESMKFTVGQVEERAYLDPVYQEASEIRENLKRIEEMLEAVVDGLWHKKSMLESLTHRASQERGIQYSADKTETLNADFTATFGPARSGKSREELEDLAENILSRSKNHGT